ncbi:MAG: hypothetical protein OEX19_02650, partial [Gammaproteobacteria bacterium]|nr:hypothetical protein [Gammaproteobacteria bacterium]
ASFESGGFGGPTVTFTDMINKASWGIGGKGAWLINHSYYIGGAAYNTFIRDFHNGGVLLHEGLILGYIVQPNRIFHFTFEMLIGGGQLILEQESGSDAVFAAEPQVYLSVNLSRVAVLNIGVSYRYINGNNGEYLDSALSGASLNTNIIFGRF